MGKAARVKAEKQKPPPPVGKRQGVSQRTVLLGTIGLIVLIIAVAGGLAATRSSPKKPPPAAASASDKSAPASLVKAANAIGFSPNTEAGVGTIESKPASAANAPSNASLLPVGSTAPDFTLKTPEGQPVSLSSYRGKATLLEFFATWCPHCDAEAPHLRSIFSTLPSAKYGWLSVNADGEDAASVYAYHRYFGLRDPAVLDLGSGPATGNFRQPGTAFPTFYVIDPNGKVAWASDGEQPDALIRQQLQKAAGA
jgi:thiol-disulfide isomerase/thioredoxin